METEVFKKRLNKAAKESCKGHQHAMRYQPMLEQFKKGAEWAKNNPEWISVNDRLPENYTDVLVIITNSGQSYVPFVTEHLENGSFKHEHDDGLQIADYSNLITHWMPLPSPPST